MKRLVLAAPFLATMTCLAGEIETVDSSPFAEGGDYIRRITIDEHHWSYIHVFTNASAVQTFKSTVGWPLKVRYLVVGGGGAGGTGESNNGGGGGGGGGVAEVANVPFAAGSSWAVRVGAGAVVGASLAGESAISNGVTEVCAVPGGGSGGTGSVGPFSGAAGGGGALGANAPGAAGLFASFVLGMQPPTSGYAGGMSRYYAGGGGGGAGAAGADGTSPASYTYVGGNGGEGLASDITGENFVYGSGGGGGALNGTSNMGPGGLGGTNAGNGGGLILETKETTKETSVPTKPVANSGAGGGGGCGNKGKPYTIGSVGADGIVVIRYDYTDYPCEGGDWVKMIPKSANKTTYIHIFTNVQDVGTFYNRSGKDLKMRYLVVGGGGAGGSGNRNYGGGGGGGGGVAEGSRVVLPAGTGWTVRVGAGSTSELTQAGGSSISNGINEVCAVPGGGSGGRLESDGVTYGEPIAGAAGGGGTSTPSNTRNVGASGTFASYVLGMTRPEGGYSGGKSFSFWGGGGGGAGESGQSQEDNQARRGGDGGEGLSSDITGESFVYGSGGGGGALDGSSNYGPGGFGGTNAGNGAGVVGKSSTESGTEVLATAPVANSGAGGGGGSGTGTTSFKSSTMGADGIVVIRYDYSPVDPGMMLIFR